MKERVTVLQTFWLTVTLFLVILHAQGHLSSNVTVKAILGGSFRFRIENEKLSYEDDDKCEVRSPTMENKFLSVTTAPQDILNGIEYYQSPTSNDTHEQIICGLKVQNFTVDQVGNWTLIINRSSSLGLQNVTRHFTVQATDAVITTNVVPKEQVTIIEGQNLYLRFASGAVKNLVECSVNRSNGGEVILEPGAEPSVGVQYWGSGEDGSTFHDECGVKATNITIDDSGNWTLQVRNTSGDIIQGVFNVKVIKPTAHADVEKTVVSGNYASLPLSAENSKYCLWKSPSSEIEEPSAKPCEVKINTVTKSSEGNWSATFAVPGQIEEMQKNTLVTVQDAETVQASITPSSRFKDGLDLLCRWTTYKYASNTAKFCRFMRPDGVAFSLEDGIGNEDYSYFGEGINYSGNVKDCGITIRSPETRDEGNWQCVIGGLMNELKGSFIKVPTTRRTQALGLNETTENVSRSDIVTFSGGEQEVLVESGKDVTFGCRATASLNYCWFKHPNGTALTPKPDKKTTRSSSVTYSGLGLALGECKITVSEASIEDTGEWTCNMGIQGEPDTKISINVRVSDGNIISKISQVVLPSGDSVDLGCKTVPVGEALAYCRFVRPDGISFGFTANTDEVLSRYSYSGLGLEKGACGVKIEPVHSEDFGQWDCYALHAQSTEEGKASINLVDGRVLSGGAVAGIVIGCIIAVAAFGGVIFAHLRRKRRLSGTELGPLARPASL